MCCENVEAVAHISHSPQLVYSTLSLPFYLLFLLFNRDYVACTIPTVEAAVAL